MDLMISLAHFCEEHGPQSLMCTRVVPSPCSACPSSASSSPQYPLSPPPNDPVLSPRPCSSKIGHSKTPSFSRRTGTAIRSSVQSAISAQRDEIEKQDASALAFDTALKRLPDQVASSLCLNRYTGQMSLPGMAAERGCASCTLTLPPGAAGADPDTPTLRTKITRHIKHRERSSNRSSATSSVAHSPRRASINHHPTASRSRHSIQRHASRTGIQKPQPMMHKDDGICLSTSTTDDDEARTPPRHIMDSGIAMSEYDDQYTLFDSKHSTSHRQQLTPHWMASPPSVAAPRYQSQAHPHTHTLNYLSQRYPPTQSQHSILKRACIRALSCETTYFPPNQTPFALPSSLPSTANASDGALLFGDAQAGYTIAHLFKLRDERARGGLRNYALLCVGSKDLDLMMRVFSPVTRCFRAMIQRITALSERQAAKRADRSGPGAGIQQRPLSPLSPLPGAAGFRHADLEPHRRRPSGVLSPLPPTTGPATAATVAIAPPSSGYASRSRRVSASMAHTGFQHQKARTVPVALTEILGREGFFVHMHAEFVKSLVQLAAVAEAVGDAAVAVVGGRAAGSVGSSRPVSRRVERGGGIGGRREGREEGNERGGVGYGEEQEQERLAVIADECGGGENISTPTMRPVAVAS